MENCDFYAQYRFDYVSEEEVGALCACRGNLEITREYTLLIFSRVDGRKSRRGLHSPDRKLVRCRSLLSSDGHSHCFDHQKEASHSKAK